MRPVGMHQAGFRRLAVIADKQPVALFGDFYFLLFVAQSNFEFHECF
jgi:hypothetical protein